MCMLAPVMRGRQPVRPGPPGIHQRPESIRCKRLLDDSAPREPERLRHQPPCVALRSPTTSATTRRGSARHGRTDACRDAAERSFGLARDARLHEWSRRNSTVARPLTERPIGHSIDEATRLSVDSIRATHASGRGGVRRLPTVRANARAEPERGGAREIRLPVFEHRPAWSEGARRRERRARQPLVASMVDPE